MDLIVPTSLGPSRLVVDEAPEAHAVLWLGHGAGGGIQVLDLAALATALPRQGITVVRHEQPWRFAGRRVAPRPATLDMAWIEAAPRVAELAPGGDHGMKVLKSSPIDARGVTDLVVRPSVSSCGRFSSGLSRSRRSGLGLYITEAGCTVCACRRTHLSMSRMHAAG